MFQKIRNRAKSWWNHGKHKKTYDMVNPAPKAKRDFETVDLKKLDKKQRKNYEQNKGS